MPLPAYAFDATGTNPLNYVQNEMRTINDSNGINAYVILPEFRPFYELNFTLVDGGTGRTLKKGVDFYLTHKWNNASMYIGNDIYGSITLLHGYSPGAYFISYQTLGGDYIDKGPATLEEGLIASDNTYLTVDWSTAPAFFPSLPHNVSLSDLDGMAYVLRGLDNIASAIANPVSFVGLNDIHDYDTAVIQDPLSTSLEDKHTEFANSSKTVETLLKLFTDLNYYRNIQEVDVSTLSCTHALAGGLIVHVGLIPFTTLTTPAEIRFTPTTKFNFNCLYLHAVVTPAVLGGVLYEDRVILGAIRLRPNGEVIVALKIQYKRNKDLNTPMTLRYIALGV
jgi:hypothetical protein